MRSKIWIRFVGKKHSWKYLSLVGDETIINLQRAKVYVFSDSVLCLGKIHQHPNANESWKERTEWITISQRYRDYDGISKSPTEFEWNIFPGFTTLQLHGKVTDLLSRLGETPENFTGRILFMSMFNDISCGSKDNERGRTSYGWEICCGRRSIRETWETVTTRLFRRGLWSILVFSRVEKWSSGARSIRETWKNFLGYDATSCSLIVKILFSTEMRIP